VREEWLLAQPARMILTRRSKGVQRIEFEWDRGKRVNQATVTLLASAAAVLPGDRIDLKDVGAGTGKYLVSTVRRRRFSPLVSVDLKRAAKALPEPAAEVVTTRRGGSSGRGGDPGNATGNWQWPTNPHPVTSPFGQRWGRLHDGIDIGVPTGTTVRAVDGGKVTKAGPNGGYGTYVEIDHGGGLVSFYGHLSSISVRSGQRVGKGDAIARSGNTGHSTGPHLHFGVHKGGAARNPRDYL
jgi:murein DD-endopeptidase MepM/ murein hydrolase activator NlpD